MGVKLSKIDEIFTEIESIEYSCRLGIASGLSVFKNLMSRQMVYQDLKSMIDMEEPGVLEAVTTRALQVSKIPFNPRYEHPGDHALATYLFLLGNKIDTRITENMKISSWWWANEVIYSLSQT